MPAPCALPGGLWYLRCPRSGLHSGGGHLGIPSNQVGVHHIESLLARFPCNCACQWVLQFVCVRSCVPRFFKAISFPIVFLVSVNATMYCMFHGSLDMSGITTLLISSHTSRLCTYARTLLVCWGLMPVLLFLFSFYVLVGEGLPCNSVYWPNFKKCLPICLQTVTGLG